MIRTASNRIMSSPLDNSASPAVPDTFRAGASSSSHSGASRTQRTLDYSDASPERPLGSPSQILLAPASPPRFHSPLRNASPNPGPASRGFGRGPSGAASSSSSSFNQLTLLASGDDGAGSPVPSSSGAQFAGGAGGGVGMGMGSRTPMTAPPASRSRMAAYSSPSPDPRYPSPGQSSGYDSESSPSVADVAAAALSDVSEEDLRTRTPVMVGKRALMGVEGMGMSGSPGFLSGFIASRPKNDRAEMLDPKFYLEVGEVVCGGMRLSETDGGGCLFVQERGCGGDGNVSVSPQE
ncbi:unnamed protein product [Closterium sp. NIES-64]|nr:unnamed protein product [Closterium sp. NIES-64]